jgi:hypothetical protein
VIIGKNRKRTLVEQFERFALHYGSEINFCNPNSEHEKGNIENKVGYVRRNMFVPIPVFNNMDEYNKDLLKLGDLDIQRPHYKKDGIIANLFEEEKNLMFKLPNKEFEVGRIKNVIADKYGEIEFETNIYSTSPAYSGKEVILKATSDKEVKQRKIVRKNRYLKQAGFDVIKIFENYTFDQIEIPSTIKIDELIVMKNINVLGYQYLNAFIFYTNQKFNIENEKRRSLGQL